MEDIKSIIYLVQQHYKFFIIIPSLISIYFTIIRSNKRAPENIKKRYEYYKEIITNINNKVLAYTGLKEYIGFSISDEFAERIITSTIFYEIINVLKITQVTNIDYNPTTNKIIYKRKRLQMILMMVFIIFYIIFFSIFILFLMFIDKIMVQPKEYLIVSIMLVILCILLFTLCAIEAGNRKMVFSLLRKLNNEGNVTVSDTNQGIPHALAMRKAESYIRENFTKKINLHEIAEHAGLSATYFSTIFKREMGENFSQYVNRLRVEKASKMLLETDSPLSEISSACCFEDQSWFSKIFKSFTGISPGKYRHQGGI